MAWVVLNHLVMNEIHYQIINVINHVMLIGLSVTFIVMIYKIARMKRKH